MLANYKQVATSAKEFVLQKDAAAKVYVFGSVVKGKYTASSDIDLLIITKRKEELEYHIKLNVRKNMLGYPLEIHVVTPEELKWYLRFIKPDEMIEI